MSSIRTWLALPLFVALGCGGGGGDEEIDAGDSPTPALALSSDATQLRIVNGEQTTLSFTIERQGGLEGEVLVEILGLPTGVSADPVTVPAASNSATVVVQAAGSAPHAGPLELTVRAASSDGAVEASLGLRGYVAGLPGALDNSFGISSQFAIAPFPAGDFPNIGTVSVDSQGRTLIAVGQDTDTIDTGFVLRLTANGAADADFGNAGFLGGFSGESSDVRGVIIRGEQFDVVARSTRSVGESVFYVRRMNADGTVDQSFGVGGDAELPVVPARWQPAGDGMVIGNANGVYRVSGDGTLDDGFTSPTPLPFFPWALVAGPDGTVVVGSTALADFQFTRYSASGPLDPSYGTAGVQTLPSVPATHDGYIEALLLNDDGSVIAVGANRLAASWDGTVLKLTEAGALDTAFGTGGRIEVEPASIPTAGLLDREGNILVVVGPESGVSAPRLVRRYTPNGVLDATFGTGGTVDTEFARGVRLGHDSSAGRFVLCGYTSVFVDADALYTIRCQRYWL